MKKKVLGPTETVKMEYHTSFTIYTAGPIDLGADMPNWRQKVAEELATLFPSVPVTLFDPSSAYKHSHWGVATTDLSHEARAEYISRVNEAALMNADVMLVSLPAGVQSVGTILEMKLAKDSGVPMYLITDIPVGKSAYLDLLVSDDRRFKWTDQSDLSMILATIVNDVSQMGTRSDRIVTDKAK